MSADPHDYSAAVEYLYGRINFERIPAGDYRSSDLKLERMAALLEALGNPQERVPVVHIAGTKGKGSTATLTAAMLTAAGLRTGLFTSPHLEQFEERIRIGGRMIPAADVVRLVADLRVRVSELERTNPALAPTFFELTTALAWMWFAEQGVDIAVLEVGLGGRLDATNLCRPLVTVITSISRDHMQQLGDTIGEIAAEKAGIIKPGVPVLSGAVRPEASAVIAAKAADAGAPCYELHGAIRVAAADAEFSDAGRFVRWWQVTTPWREHPRLELPLVGLSQGDNLALAVAAMDALAQQGWAIGPEAIARGAADVVVAGRQELLGVEPLVLLDSAHNEASTQALVDSLQQPPFAGRNKMLIYASTRDKDVEAQLRLLVPHFERVLLTAFRDNPRACPPEQLLAAARAAGAQACELVLPAEAALERALRETSADGCLVIAGSFYLSGELRPLLLARQKNRQPASA